MSFDPVHDDAQEIPPKRILLVKTSSMGDIIHTFYALTDALKAYPNLEVDWVVEEAFAQLPILHPAVKRVFPVAIRRWRKSFIKTLFSGEIRAVKQQIRAQDYECIIDAQGLLKSAWLTKWHSAKTLGYNKHSIKEPLASKFYAECFDVSKSLHAVERMRHLFAKALAYQLPNQAGVSDLSIPQAVTAIVDKHCPEALEGAIMLIHGTTWESKHAPIEWWQGLIKAFEATGQSVVIPWSNETEKTRAQILAQGSGNVVVLPKLNLIQFAAALAKVKGVVAVDTGPAHLAAAIGVKTVGIYGATRSDLTGLYGVNVKSLQADFECSPCMKRECQYALNEKGNGVQFEMVPPCYTAINFSDVIKVFEKV